MDGGIVGRPTILDGQQNDGRCHERLSQQNSNHGTSSTHFGDSRLNSPLSTRQGHENNYSKFNCRVANRGRRRKGGRTNGRNVPFHFLVSGGLPAGTNQWLFRYYKLLTLFSYFRKFVSSIIPTINYDFTMDVTASTKK